MAAAGHTGGTNAGSGSLWGSGSGGGDAPSRPAPRRSVNPQDNLPALPGSYSLDVTSPDGLAKAMRDNVTESQDLLRGFQQTLFGENNGSILGGVPIVGNIGRGAGDIIGGVGDTINNVAKTIGGGLEHIHFEDKERDQELQRTFDSIPDDNPHKQEALAAIANDQGAAGHYMYKAATEWTRETRATGNQKLGIWDTPELATPGGSVADTLSQLFAGMGLAARPLQRAATGTNKITSGLNRLQEIEAVHDGAVYTGIAGTGAFSGGQDGKGYSGNSEIEEIALAKWKSGEWTVDEANDFLVATGKNEHDPGLAIASSIVLDPTVFGSLGASAVARLGVTGARLAASAPGVTIRAGQTAGKANVLGKVAESDKVASVVRWLGQHPYDAMKAYGPTGEVVGRSALGTGAKAVRTIIDPLHAIGGNKAIGEATVDLAAEATPRIMAEAHGWRPTFDALNLARETSPAMFDSVIEDAATYSTNLVRKTLMRTHVASMVLQGLGKDLIGKSPNDIIDTLFSTAPQDYVRVVKEEMIRVREMLWGETERANLGRRMAAFYGESGAEEWTAKLADMSPETLSYLHAATYGRATKRFLGVIESATASIGVAKAKKLKLERLVLLNRGTLTDVGAQGILKRMDEAATPVEKMAVVKEAQGLYPELRYIAVDAANLDVSLVKFQNHLTKAVSDGHLPAQLLDDEIAKLPDELRDLHADTSDVFGFAFRPEDDLTMGLIYDGEKYVAGFEPWVDHVAATGGAGFRGSVALAHNVAGMPILGQPIARGLDFMEANARTLTSRVTSAAITESAKTRFVVRAAERHGLTESQAKAMFEGIAEASQLRKLTARGLSSTDMWEAARHIVPADLYQLGKFRERDLLNLVLDAYEGDLRFIGLTQKFTGRAKAIFAHKTGSNFAGQVAEDLYLKIRYRYNPIFQVQERIEPWVLNGQRGVRAAVGTKMDETDRLTAKLYEKMRDTGLIRSSDIDQAEYSVLALQGTDATQALSRHAPPGRWEQLRDISGTKRINLLRTLQRNMGKSLRASFEKHEPGSWDRIVQNYTDRAGHLISDDEAAVRFLTEQGFATDVKVASIIDEGSTFDDFQKAISTGEWHLPANIGELKGLDLDFMTKALGLPKRDGTIVHDLHGLRAALADADSGVTMDKVSEALRIHGAHPDYVRRVENALDFHWDGFWRTVQDKYNLSRAERTSIELMMANAARVRGMTGVDYMSQVFSPRLLAGKGADVGAMESAVSVLRYRTKKTGGSIGTQEDLLTQLADVFHHHLDPSAQDTLLEAFEKQLPGDIQAAYDAGKTKAGQALNTVAEQLRGGESSANPVVGKGWTVDSSRQFAKQVLVYMETGVGEPDVIRAAQFMSKWSKDALADGLLTGGKNPYSDLLTRVTGIPTDNAVPFNQMQQLLVNQVGNSMRQGATDAFRLQYFAQERTWLERSINHPFFGIYPASYMWGKIAPEMARFMARSPFGVRTGAAAYAAQDFVKAVALQRELDPEFEQTMEKLGHSPTAWFMGYMLPSLPWDVGAAAPTWARDLAGQSLDNQDRMDRGLPPRPINLTSPLDRIANYINPLRPLEQVERPVAELGDVLHGSKADIKAHGGPKTIPIVGPFPDQVAPSGPIQGTGIGAVIIDDMAALEEILANP